MKYLLAILFVSFSCFGQSEKLPDSISASIKTPKFPGGEEAFRKYFISSFNSPDIDFADNYIGKMDIYMVIDETGQISSIKVRKNAGYGLDHEAIRLIKKLHLKKIWQPALKNDQPIKVWCNIHIIFSKLAKKEELVPSLEFSFSEFVPETVQPIPANMILCGNKG